MSIWIDDIEVILTGNFIKYANVAPESYELIGDHEALIKKILARRGVDIVSFGQRLPNTEPRYKYFNDWEEVAALKITTYDHWLSKQIIKENKKNIAKAAKKGIIVRESKYDDQFVNGIMDIYNESPYRQGKRFLHFDKDFETVKVENGTYCDKSIFIGAYYKDLLIGFVKLFLSERCASTLQVISKIEHRDKKPTNALLAKAVEICASRGIQYLQYGVWSSGSLGRFKTYNGFEKMLLPKYYVPVTLKGKAAIAARLHRGIRSVVPRKAVEAAIYLRSKWYSNKVAT